MKRIHSLFALLAIALLSFCASATTITVNVDSKERVAFGYIYKMYGFLDMKQPIALENDGDNTVELPDNATAVYVEGQTGFDIVSVEANGEAVADWSNFPFSEGMVITVTSQGQTAAGTINFVCDDYTLVNVSMRSDVAPYQVTLTANECQVDYFAGDFALDISSANSEKPILKVLRNGNEVSKGFSGWVVEPLEDGMTVQVVTDEEQVVKYPVSFDFKDDNAKNYITAVTVNDEPIEDFAAGFEVKENTVVSLACNNQITDVKVNVNGVEKTPMPFTGAILFSVAAATVVEAYTVAPAQKDSIYINLDNAQVVEVGYKEDYETFFGVQERSVALTGLVDGINKVEVGDTWKCLYVKIADSMYELASVLVDGEPVENVDNIAIVAEMLLFVTTKHVDPAGTIHLTTDDYTAFTAALRGDNGERAVTLEGNEADIEFYASEWALVLYSVDSANPIISVTSDGNPVSGRQGTFIVEPIADGMQVDVKCIPLMYNVKMEFSDENARAYVTSVTCNQEEVEGFDAAEGFDVKENSALVLNLDQVISNVVVTVNDAVVDPISIPGMKFITLDITGNTVIKVESEKVKTFTVTLDHADYVAVGWNKPHSTIPGYKEKVLFEGLVDGDNVIEIPADCTTVFVEPASESYEITEVTLDGATVEPVLYSEIPVVDGSIIAVASSTVSGIEGIVAEGGSVDVYNMQGIAVLKGADASAVTSLPRGLYIVNGKKFYRR